MLVEKRVVLNEVRKKIVFKSIGLCKEEKESGFTSSIQSEISDRL